MKRTDRPGDIAKIGRPSLMTAKRTESIVALLNEGKPLTTALAINGISPNVFRGWVEKAALGDVDAIECVEQIATAQARGEVALLSVALAGDERGVSNGPARCAQWMLERTNRKYAPKQTLKLEQGLEHVINVVEQACSGRECGCYGRILAALAAFGSMPDAAAAAEEDDSWPAAGS